MNDYFDQIEAQLRGAVRSRAHISAVRRIWLSRSRALLSCFAVLVIATLAVAAVGGLFSSGPRNAYGPVSATAGAGAAIPKAGRLLSLRVSDPDGGPPWGLRLIRTTRGETCVQLGRVQGAQLGSLGIDHYWADDGRFHPILPDDYFARQRVVSPTRTGTGSSPRKSRRRAPVPGCLLR